MKIVKLSHPNYEYDVHSLVKAFYAEEQVTVITPETKPEKLAELEPQASLEIELGETGAKIRVGEETFLWDAETENLADGYKNGLKRFLYRTLSKVTGQELPWGNLTGIRPTKIAYGMLDEGRSDAEILDFMEQSHYVSEEKALLGIDIAKRERDLLKEIHYEGGYSLYIGIPFCPTTCLYCSFTSYPIAAFRRQVDAYVDAVIKEMDYVAENFQDKVLDTVYIGGGTPTTLEPEQLDRLITALKSKFDFSTVKEFTVEAGRA
uniref:radical SAM protein n=1 Tax=Waltera sp. TaxID=2815806 RepID=UPI003AB313F3